MAEFIDDVADIKLPVGTRVETVAVMRQPDGTETVRIIVESLPARLTMDSIVGIAWRRPDDD